MAFQKGSSRCFAGFLCCVKVSHDCLYTCCTGEFVFTVAFNFTGITFEVGVLDIAARAFVYLLISSSASVSLAV